MRISVWTGDATSHKEIVLSQATWRGTLPEKDKHQLVKYILQIDNDNETSLFLFHAGRTRNTERWCRNMQAQLLWLRQLIVKAAKYTIKWPQN